MKTMELNRRQFLKTTGALVVSFNLFPPSSDLFGQSSPAASGEPDPTQLDSWIAVSQDGTVTIFTSKVELGTGIETALAQIAAEELDVPLRKIKVDMGDTSKTIDQATTSGSRTIERAGPQVRQAAAAARKELLRMAAEKTRRSCREAHRARRSGQRPRKSIKTHFLRAVDRRQTF